MPLDRFGTKQLNVIGKSAMALSVIGMQVILAAAKRKHGMEYHYALESWFDYNVERGNYTPVEFFSPPQPDGSLLQAWSGAAAFVEDEEISGNFWD